MLNNDYLCINIYNMEQITVKQSATKTLNATLFNKAIKEASTSKLKRGTSESNGKLVNWLIKGKQLILF